MRKMSSLLLTLSVAAILSAGCGGTDTATTPSGTAQANAGPLEVDTVKVATQKLDTAQSIPGELVPYEMVAIYPKVTGFVKAISVDRGSRVKQGELLAQIEAPEIVAQRNEAESKLATAQSQLAAAQAKLNADRGTFERLSAAAKTPGVVAGNEVHLAEQAAEASQANVAAMENSVKAAQSALGAVSQMEAYLRITAPFDGVVTERNVHPGALVGPAGGSSGGVPILRIETVSRLRLVVPVPEGAVADIPSQTPVEFTVAAYPTETFQGRIARISHAIDQKTRTMPVELDVANAAGKLTPGTFCQVQWPSRRSYMTHFVPTSAVTTNQERTFVIAVRAGKAEWVDVKTGSNPNNLIEVFGNLNDGDEVVLRATDAIRPDTPVKPRLTAAAH